MSLAADGAASLALPPLPPLPGGCKWKTLSNSNKARLEKAGKGKHQVETMV
jgi:hypothetical protein